MDLFEFNIDEKMDIINVKEIIAAKLKEEKNKLRFHHKI